MAGGRVLSGEFKTGGWKHSRAWRLSGDAVSRRRTFRWNRGGNRRGFGAGRNWCTNTQKVGLDKFLPPSPVQPSRRKSGALGPVRRVCALVFEVEGLAGWVASRWQRMAPTPSLSHRNGRGRRKSTRQLTLSARRGAVVPRHDVPASIDTGKMQVGPHPNPLPADWERGKCDGIRL
jgi:hypothetical protein